MRGQSTCAKESLTQTVGPEVSWISLPSLGDEAWNFTYRMALQSRASILRFKRKGNVGIQESLGPSKRYSRFHIVTRYIVNVRNSETWQWLGKTWRHVQSHVTRSFKLMISAQGYRSGVAVLAMIQYLNVSQIRHIQLAPKQLMQDTRYFIRILTGIITDQNLSFHLSTI